MNIKYHLCGKEIESGVFNQIAHTEVCVPSKAIIKKNLKKISKQKLAEDSTTKWLSFKEWKAQEEYLRNHPLNRRI